MLKTLLPSAQKGCFQEAEHLCSCQIALGLQSLAGSVTRLHTYFQQVFQSVQTSSCLYGSFQHVAEVLLYSITSIFRAILILSKGFPLNALGKVIPFLVNTFTAI